MSLKTLVSNRIFNDVLRHNQKSGKTEWRVLVVDKISLKILSSTIKMHQLSAEGITLVETLEKKREPMPNMEAIYFITPSEESISILIDDFRTGALYKAIHVYTTEEIPETLFGQISKSEAAKKMKSLVEINMSFAAYESKVFHLDIEPCVSLMYANESSGLLERMAEQLATLCSTLGEFPSIRYRAECGMNKQLAEMLHQRLQSYKEAEPSMGEGLEKAKSQLIILDRGFDVTSPLLHELTYQAMAYDLLNIKSDIYKYTTSMEVAKEVILDENDELWEELRHQHIAVVNQTIPQKVKKFSDEKKLLSLDNDMDRNGNDKDKKKSDKYMRDLAMMIKKTPQHQAEMSKFTLHLNIADECMRNYQGYVDKLCKVEQDLAMGTDADGEKLSKNPMNNIVPLLLDTNVTVNDKIRIILLYILYKQGISETNLNKLVEHAQIPQDKVSIIKNMSKLGVTIVEDKSKSQNWNPKRKDRITEGTYQMSRWTPIIKDIIEDAIDGNLDSSHFPYLSDQRGQSKRSNAPTRPERNKGKITANQPPQPPKRFFSNWKETSFSNRYGRWHKDKGEQTRNVSRVIIFIIGGATFSEARAGYEVSKDKSASWEVIVGGDTKVITPEEFLYNVANLETVN